MRTNQQHRYRQRFVDEHFDVKMRREYDNEEEWGEIGDDEVEVLSLIHI